MLRRAVAMLISPVLLVVVLPTAARAQISPICPDVSLATLPGTPVDFPTPTCQNTAGAGLFLIAPGGAPANGTVMTGDPNVYTPRAGFHGVDPFKYTVADPF